MSSKMIRNVLLPAFSVSFIALAQAPPPPPPPPPAEQQAPVPSTGSQAVASSLGVFVYPAKGQDTGTQAKDENECYNWAKQQTKIDPNTKVAVATPTPIQGGAVKGAARGAAGGAVVGAIADDTGTGAAIGAAAGAVKGRRAQKQANAAAQQQAQQQSQQINQAQKDTFKKAFSACMEGRGYTVK